MIPRNDIKHVDLSSTYIPVSIIRGIDWLILTIINSNINKIIQYNVVLSCIFFFREIVLTLEFNSPTEMY